jgi:hypothetical protein
VALDVFGECSDSISFDGSFECCVEAVGFLGCCESCGEVFGDGENLGERPVDLALTIVLGSVADDRRRRAEA